LLKIDEQRPTGEIAGLYILRSGAPCVADAYRGYLERFIAQQRLPDLFLLHPGKENDFCGFDEATLAKNISPALFVADILVEIGQVLRVVGAEGSTKLLAQAWEHFTTAAITLRHFQEELPGFIKQLAAIPRRQDPQTCPRVVVTGDFFTRFSPFFMEGIHDRYAAQGIILKPADLNDLLLYATYHSVAETAGEWGLKPGGRALAKACTRAFQDDGKKYLQHWFTYHADRGWEAYYRRLFRPTGLLVSSRKNVSALFDKAAEHVSPTIFGEVIPTVGQGLKAESEGYDGILVIGPFNCLPFRISEAILKPLGVQQGMPVLTYESDGFAVSSSVLRQVDVHIQQVLEHAAKATGAPLDATEKFSSYFKAAVDKWR
jgi:predicted nucleotide-binding protein (sugar kinase/HSP70/actin superfamily)